MPVAKALTSVTVPLPEQVPGDALLQAPPLTVRAGQLPEGVAIPELLATEHAEAVEAD
jgi:hypothetical protein